MRNRLRLAWMTGEGGRVRRTGGHAETRPNPAQICCAPTREGPRRVRSARVAGLWRRAAGGPGPGGASAGRGRGAEAIASTSMAAENTTVTVSWSLIKTSYTLLDEFTS